DHAPAVPASPNVFRDDGPDEVQSGRRTRFVCFAIWFQLRARRRNRGYAPVRPTSRVAIKNSETAGWIQFEADRRARGARWGVPKAGASASRIGSLQRDPASASQLETASFRTIPPAE